MIRDATTNSMIGVSKLVSQMLASDNNFQPSFVLDRSIPIKVMKTLIVLDANKVQTLIVYKPNPLGDHYNIAIGKHPKLNFLDAHSLNGKKDANSKRRQFKKTPNEKDANQEILVFMKRRTLVLLRSVTLTLNQLLFTFFLSASLLVN